MWIGSQGRGHLNQEKEEFAHEHAHVKTLGEVVQIIKPTAIIGEQSHPGLKRADLRPQGYARSHTTP